MLAADATGDNLSTSQRNGEEKWNNCAKVHNLIEDGAKAWGRRQDANGEKSPTPHRGRGPPPHPPLLAFRLFVEIPLSDVKAPHSHAGGMA